MCAVLYQLFSTANVWHKYQRPEPPAFFIFFCAKDINIIDDLWDLLQYFIFWVLVKPTTILHVSKKSKTTRYNLWRKSSCLCGRFGWVRFGLTNDGSCMAWCWCMVIRLIMWNCVSGRGVCGEGWWWKIKLVYGLSPYFILMLTGVQ